MKNTNEIYLSRNERSAFFKVARGQSISRDMQRKLGSSGLVRVLSYHPSNDRSRCELTQSGERYLDYLTDKRNDRRWTRGLAIVALIVSVAALCVSALSLWLQYRSQ